MELPLTASSISTVVFFFCPIRQYIHSLLFQPLFNSHFFTTATATKTRLNCQLLKITSQQQLLHQWLMNSEHKTHIFIVKISPNLICTVHCSTLFLLSFLFLWYNLAYIIRATSIQRWLFSAPKMAVAKRADCSLLALLRSFLFSTNLE